MDIIGQRLIAACLVLLVLSVMIVIVAYIGKRTAAAERVTGMGASEKEDLLDSLLSPFGYFYYARQDLVLTKVNAWQRTFGYEAFYDRAAAAGGMIFQCFPIYFVYAEKTWLLEFWKGQYGIASGCEIGLYHADGIVAKEDYARTHFESVSDEEMQNFTIILEGEHMEDFVYRKKHWWLAAFRVGEYHAPKQLRASYQIRFQNLRMLQAVWKGLKEAEYPPEQYSVLCNTLVIRHHTEDAVQRGVFGKAYARWVLLKNRCLVKLYRCYTAPFECTLDRVLFLYFRMPILFRRLFGRPVNVRCGRKQYGGVGYGISQENGPGL